MIHYLGPTVGKIPLATWDQIESAAHGGAFEESQWVELKEMIPRGKPTNIELARDLASLSVHGGVLIVGIKDKTCEVVGTNVQGLRDRISQVASMQVHPPLSPVIYPDVLPPNGDLDTSILVIEVPASPQAPHMVDGAYWGRSSNGKRKLADPEVRDLLAARSRTDAAFKERLLAMVADDPVNQRVMDAPTGNGHVYLLAEPCAPVTGRAADFDLASAVRNGVGSNPKNNVLGALSERARDPLGLAMAYPAAAEPNAERWHEDRVAYLLVRDEDSSVEFVSGGGTYFRRGGPRGEQDVEAVGTNIIIGAVREFLELIKDLSLTHWGYTGQWRIGLHVTGLDGKPLSFSDLRFNNMTFPRDTVTSQIVTSPATWDEGIDPVAKQILAGFLRAIGRATWDLDDVIER